MSLQLTLYHRHACHLCEQMLAELQTLYGDRVQLTLVDIDTDAVLQQRYATLIPVLMGGDTLLGVGRLDRSRLEDYLDTHGL
jgi:hypothetical protein